MNGNEDVIQCLFEQKEDLEKRVKDLTRENNRKTYMASGYIALIIETGNKDLIQRAKEIADEADKLY